MSELEALLLAAFYIIGAVLIALFILGWYDSNAISP